MFVSREVCPHCKGVISTQVDQVPVSNLFNPKDFPRRIKDPARKEAVERELHTIPGKGTTEPITPTVKAEAGKGEEFSPAVKAEARKGGEAGKGAPAVKAEARKATQPQATQGRSTRAKVGAVLAVAVKL